jgi:hypothetical protein
MKSVFLLGASLAAVSLVALLPACSSKSVAAQPSCDSKQCAPGNACLPLAGEVKCRKSCGSNVDPATSCPFGYSCVAPDAPLPAPVGCTAFPATGVAQICGDSSQAAYECKDINAAIPAQCRRLDSNLSYVCCPQAFCVKDTTVVTKAPGQWGTACNPTKGLDANPDCDSAQGFYCHGTGPADASAYCTHYDCTTDRDCAGGYFCATINVAPNVTTSKATLHETTKACLRRDYCAPCKADLDCGPLNGVTQHCVTDDNGAGFCTPECTDSKNCNFEAKCVDPGIGVKTCYPRAGVCIGDGTLCAPCRADSECGDDGLCIKGQYSTEHFCAKKSAVKCQNGVKMCPPSSAPKAQLGCTTMPDGDLPADYCVGLYNFGPPSQQGQGTDLGCWTPAR